MNLEETLKTLTEEITNMISTKTVVGEHIVIEGHTIIPVTKVSFGFGSGGGESKEQGTGAGGGGGACVQPIAFVVVSKEDVQVFAIKEKGVIERITAVIPEILEKCKSMKEAQ
ncbi:Sporulation protein YtfJ (Spore_YtfJ) [uncultured archaeon]|nr:Sporulation protein YtfJ (Spore_YtfJ) [uncultured archaeon]